MQDEITKHGKKIYTTEAGSNINHYDKNIKYIEYIIKQIDESITE